MMHPHPSSLPTDYHQLRHHELIAEADARRLATRGRRRVPGRIRRRR